MIAVIPQPSGGAISVNQPPNQPPNPESRTFLYIIGVSIGLALLLTAFVYLLLGIGVIKGIPTYVIWAIVLFSIGTGILSGVTMRR